MRIKGTTNHKFSETPSATIPRSSFDRSHGCKTTFDAGLLIPVFVDEALPGDTFNLRMTAFARLATPIYPIMDNLYMNSFFFAVPYRLLWDNWEKFNGAQDNPGDPTDFITPQMGPEAGGYPSGSIYDYMGLPTLVQPFNHSALWLRAYNLIWNDWFRDENLQDSITVLTDDGPDPVATYELKRRGKRHDYFTSGLPWPQKGPAVELPLGTTAPIVPEDPGVSRAIWTSDSQSGLVLQSTNASADAQWQTAAGETAELYWQDTGLVADLSRAGQ